MVAVIVNFANHGFGRDVFRDIDLLSGVEKNAGTDGEDLLVVRSFIV